MNPCRWGEVIRKSECVNIVEIEHGAPCCELVLPETGFTVTQVQELRIFVGFAAVRRRCVSSNERAQPSVDDAHAARNCEDRRYLSVGGVGGRVPAHGTTTQHTRVFAGPRPPALSSPRERKSGLA